MTVSYRRIPPKRLHGDRGGGAGKDEPVDQWGFTAKHHRDMERGWKLIQQEAARKARRLHYRRMASRGAEQARLKRETDNMIRGMLVKVEV